MAEQAEGFGAGVSLARQENGVAVLRLDRPKVNALSITLLTELARLLEQLQEDPPGAVVLTGGERVFAAGFEIDELPVGGDASAVVATFRRVADLLESLPRFTIAAINGVALGGGLELALACDWRIAAADARVGFPEVLLGLIPGGGGTQRAARLAGASKAMELVVTGRQAGAEEAERLGLVDEVVPAEEVQRRALDKAAGLARGALVAQGAGKAAVLAAFAGLEHGYQVEADRFCAVVRTEDAVTGVRSFQEAGPGKALFVGR